MMDSSSKKSAAPAAKEVVIADPAAKEVVKAPAAKKGAAPAAKGVVKVPGDLTRHWKHPVEGDITAVYGTEKSYALLVDGEGKRRLFVECTSKQTPDHAALLMTIMKESCRKKLTKSSTVLLRAKLLAKV